MSTRVLFIAGPDSRERYRFVMEPMQTTSLEVDCYRDRGNILVSIISGITYLVKRRRIHAVVLTGGDARNLVWFYIVRLITGARILIRLGGDPSSVRRSSQMSAKASGNRLRYYRGVLGFYATRFMLKRADGVIAVSQYLVETLRPLAGSKPRFCVSAPIVQCKLFEADNPGDDPHLFRFCTVSNLNYREKAEGVVFTIKALIECCRKPQNPREVVLEIAGGGRYLDYLTAAIESMAIPKNLTILVHGYQQEVAEFYARADAFLYYSTLDSYPLVLVEATANGLPILVNDWGPFPEIYENEVAALIYETGNMGSLVRVLLRLMNDSALIGDLQQGSRQQYQRNTLQARGVELQGFIEEIV